MWFDMDVSIRSQIKELLLKTFGSVQIAPQLISRIAHAEQSERGWRGFIRAMHLNLSQPNKPATLICATLDALEHYFSRFSGGNEPTICWGSYGELMSILDAIAQVMNGTEKSPQVYLAATRALNNILMATRHSISRPCYILNRDVLAKVICEATLVEDPHIRHSAMKCFRWFTYGHGRVSGCAQWTLDYVPWLFELTTNSFEAEGESVVQRKFEHVPEFCNYMKRSLPCDNFDIWSPLIQRYLETLLKQDKDRNLSLASSACLRLVARIVKDDILEPVMNFIKLNYLESDRQSREAAAHAYCVILEGPSTEKLVDAVRGTLHILLHLMKDENSDIRYTTACALSSIFQFLQSPRMGYSVVRHENVGQLVNILVESLKCATCISEKICSSICSIACTSAFLLSPYLSDIVRSLVETACRTDGDSNLLLYVACETLRVVVRYSSNEDFSRLEHLPALLSMLSETAAPRIVLLDTEIQGEGELRASFFGVLQVTLRKMGDANMDPAVLQVGDVVADLLSLFFHRRREFKVYKEEMLVTGALAYAAGAEFVKYMPRLYPYLLRGLQNFEEHQVCSMSVGAVGYICLALREIFLPHCHETMNHLKHLTSTEVHHSVKPFVFLCYGNIAVAIGGHFEEYLQDVVKTMQDAFDMYAYSDNSDDMVEYGNRLRHTTCEAFIGIVKGFSNSKADLLLPHAPFMLQLIHSLSKHKPRDEEEIKAAMTLLGSLANALCSKLKMPLKVHSLWIDTLLTELQESGNEQLKNIAVWTRQMLGSLDPTDAWMVLD